MGQQIQHKRHECRRHNVARLLNIIRFVNGLSPQSNKASGS